MKSIVLFGKCATLLGSGSIRSDRLARSSNRGRDQVIGFSVSRLHGAALIAICAFAFLEKAEAVPSDGTTASPKPIKEPKEMKEAASASKDVKDAVKAAKDAKKSKKDCAKECSAEYDPICVHDPNDATLKPRTFGSSCALDVYNCEMGKSKWSLPRWLRTVRTLYPILLYVLFRSASRAGCEEQGRVSRIRRREAFLNDERRRRGGPASLRLLLVVSSAHRGARGGSSRFRTERSSLCNVEL